MSNTWTSAGRAVQRIQRLGPRAVAQRLVGRVYRKVGAADLDFPLADADIADSTTFRPVQPATPLSDGRPLKIGWVTHPPGLGSGGHTTMFRMVKALEKAGHHTVLCLYDPSHGDIRQREAVIRQGWPGLGAEVRSIDEGWADLDVCVATSWETAHVVAVRTRNIPVRRMYFVQDFEPMFYPAGSLYSLAEDSYRLGFRIIALGNMVTNRLRNDVGLAPDMVPFGCATDEYSMSKSASVRNGVVWYARAGTARRGFELARLALAEFHGRHPEQAIHVFGAHLPDLPFPVTSHGTLTIAELNTLYNRTVAGLAMSFTNISLVAEEMLAAGTIPIVNDSVDARADMGNPHIHWAVPTPGGIADALSRAVHHADVGGRALDVAESVRGRSWAETQRAVVDLVEAEAYGRSRAELNSW